MPFPCITAFILFTLFEENTAQGNFVRRRAVNITKWMQMKPDKNLPEVSHSIEKFHNPMFLELPTYRPQTINLRRFKCYSCTGCRSISPSLTPVKGDCYECVVSYAHFELSLIIFICIFSSLLACNIQT